MENRTDTSYCHAASTSSVLFDFCDPTSPNGPIVSPCVTITVNRNVPFHQVEGGNISFKIILLYSDIICQAGPAGLAHCICSHEKVNEFRVEKRQLVSLMASIGRVPFECYVTVK